RHGLQSSPAALPKALRGMKRPRAPLTLASPVPRSSRWACEGKTLSSPKNSSFTTREDQHLFVNRRPVENRTLNFALMEGYHTALMKGRYPICCLFLEIDPGLVDVNIHPSKR